MPNDPTHAMWLTISVLAMATFAIRLTGALVGQRLPNHGPWARGLNALPGCLILSLIVAIVARGGPPEWIAAAASLGVAVATRSLPLTMAAGVLTVVAARAYI
ncbi:MAG: AzlD domain-containing protein [Pseudomonadota bacterium]